MVSRELNAEIPRSNPPCKSSQQKLALRWAHVVLLGPRKALLLLPASFVSLLVLAGCPQELRINSCSDIFHGRSFGDLAALQRLQVLAVTCISSRLAAEDLAPLEQLKQLQVRGMGGAETNPTRCRQGWRRHQAPVVQGMSVTQAQLKEAAGLVVLEWRLDSGQE